MRQRNAKFAKDVREGKKATHTSRAEKLAQRSPLSLWALGMIVFVVCGGGKCRLFIYKERQLTCPTVLFELLKIIF